MTQIRKYYEAIDGSFGGLNMKPSTPGGSQDELVERFKELIHEVGLSDIGYECQNILSAHCGHIARKYASERERETAVAFLRWRELGYWHYFPTEDVYYNGKDPSLGPYTPSELYTIFDNERKQQK